jgi:hypothetical protein
MEYAKMALFSSERLPPALGELLRWPDGDKKHRFLSFPKAQPYKSPGQIVPEWEDQFEIRLCEYMCCLTSDVGDTILDLCCGSGTYCIAGVRHGRNGVAIDIRDEAVALTLARLNEEKDSMEINVPDQERKVQNSISTISSVPHWADRDWKLVARQVASVEKQERDKVILQKENERKARAAKKKNAAAKKLLNAAQKAAKVQNRKVQKATKAKQGADKELAASQDDSSQATDMEMDIDVKDDDAEEEEDEEEMDGEDSGEEDGDGECLSEEGMSDDTLEAVRKQRKELAAERNVVGVDANGSPDTTAVLDSQPVLLPPSTPPAPVPVSPPVPPPPPFPVTPTTPPQQVDIGDDDAPVL